MTEVGIEHLAGRLCSEVSGGQFQLALIARALAAEPRILVLDEPESNLDFRNQMVVLNVIERLTSQGLGAVINTHSPRMRSRSPRRRSSSPGTGRPSSATPATS